MNKSMRKFLFFLSLILTPTLLAKSYRAPRPAEEPPELKKLDYQTFIHIMAHYDHYKVMVKNQNKSFLEKMFGYALNPALLVAAMLIVFFGLKEALKIKNDALLVKFQVNDQLKSFKSRVDELQNLLAEYFEQKDAEHQKTQAFLVTLQAVLETLPTYSKNAVTTEKNTNSIIEG